MIVPVYFEILVYIICKDNDINTSFLDEWLKTHLNCNKYDVMNLYNKTLTVTDRRSQIPFIRQNKKKRMNYSSK